MGRPDRPEPTRWSSPDGLHVTLVRLPGAHRLLAGLLGADVADDDTHAFLVTRRGGVVGRGYYASVDALSAVVSLASLLPD